MPAGNTRSAEEVTVAAETTSFTTFHLNPLKSFQDQGPYSNPRSAKQISDILTGDHPTSKIWEQQMHLLIKVFRATLNRKLIQCLFYKRLKHKELHPKTPVFKGEATVRVQNTVTTRYQISKIQIKSTQATS